MNIDKQNAKQNRAFRRKWVPAVKTIFASTGDLVGDWVFYGKTKTWGGLDKYHIPLMVFAVIATFFGILTIMSIILKNCFPTRNQKHFSSMSNVITFLLTCEMFLEDIPQLVLTTLVVRDLKGGLSGVAVFNLTTSVFNMTFNILDLFDPLPEEEINIDEDKDAGEVITIDGDEDASKVYEQDAIQTLT